MGVCACGWVGVVRVGVVWVHVCVCYVRVGV